MPAALISLKPEDVDRRLMRRQAVLVDIREPDEFARRHVRGALSRPLSTFEEAHLKVEPGRDVIFTCRTGVRTGANCERLAAVVDGPAYVLDGGVDAWAAAGLSIEEDRKAPLEIMRQVQIAAGSLVLAGVALGLAIHPASSLVSVSLFGAATSASYAASGLVDWPIFAALVAGGGLGALASGPIARRLSGQADIARRAFALMVIATAAYVAWRSLA